MELTAADVQRRLAEAGLTVSTESATALRASVGDTLAVLGQLRAERLGDTEPAAVLTAAFTTARSTPTKASNGDA